MEPQTYDYTTAGFDAYLSRAIDGPTGNSGQLNFDQTQTSGILGSSYRMGGIAMNGVDSSMTLNDGQIQINDTSANNIVTLNGGQITYQNSTGKVVAQEGVLPDNSVGFRLQDVNGKGVAQFYQDRYGVTALKVAKAGYEVSKATNDQLVFNSAQNIFKIVLTGTATVLVTAGYSSGDSFYSSTISFASLGLTATPAILAYYTPPTSGYSDGLAVPHVRTAGTFIGYAVRYLAFPVSMTFEVNMGVLVGGEGTYTFRYYVLQETAQ